MPRKFNFSWVVPVALTTLLSACASTSPTLQAPQYLATPEQTAAEPGTIADPNETFNRSVFESNQKFNHAILYPVAKAYNENVPEEARDRVTDFTTNLSEPMTFANNILQLRLQAAATTVGRFAINSTLGLGGLFDVAATQSLAHQSGDFGQTLYVWGVRESDYLVLPFLGPTNVRDAIGSGIEFAVQLPSSSLIPARMASLMSAVNTAGTIASPLSSISKVEDLQTLEDSSIDFYSMLRSVTDQKRKAELQEALDTSAFTAPPHPADPDAIEPVMTIVSSPTLLEKRPRIAPKVSAVRDTSGTIVVIGPPTATRE